MERSPRPKGMDVLGDQRPAQDLLQAKELFVCLFVCLLTPKEFYKQDI